MLGSVASVIVEYERGERWLRDGIDLAERVERWNDRHYLAAHLAHVLWATGRWDDAEAVAEHAKRDGRGGITARITADHVLGYVALGRGELERAETSLEGGPSSRCADGRAAAPVTGPVGTRGGRPLPARASARSAGPTRAGSPRSWSVTRLTCSRSR